MEQRSPQTGSLKYSYPGLVASHQGAHEKGILGRGSCQEREQRQYMVGCRLGMESQRGGAVVMETGKTRGEVQVLKDPPHPRLRNVDLILWVTRSEPGPILSPLRIFNYSSLTI